MKTGIIAWMSMARVLHDAFTTVRMMKSVNRIALANSKQKRMTAPARYDIVDSMLKVWYFSHL